MLTVFTAVWRTVTPIERPLGQTYCKLWHDHSSLVIELVIEKIIGEPVISKVANEVTAPLEPSGTVTDSKIGSTLSFARVA